MAGNPATCFADYLELLAAIGDAGEEVTIIGGHAVNLWAELYLEREPELARFAPFTSQDLDLHRPGLTARKVLRTRSAMTEEQRNPLGKAFTIVEAAFLVRNRAGMSLPIETVKMVGGLRADEIRRGTVVVEYQGVVLHVLNPIVLIKAKAYNVLHLDQKDRQDEKHFRILLVCVRTFLRDLLRQMDSGMKARVILNALEWIVKITSERDVIKVARRLGVDLSSLLPRAELERSKNPKIVNFMTKRLPEWRQR